MVTPTLDCVLCPEKAVTVGGTIYGMVICGRCGWRYLHNRHGLRARAAKDTLAWVRLVRRMRREHKLEKCPIRIATRMATALLLGLEVEPFDLTEIPPALDLWWDDGYGEG